jgi:hypothetical protein
VVPAAHNGQTVTRRADGRCDAGTEVARALSGSWRLDPPSWDVDEATLASVAPLLLQGGVGALAWRRLRSSPLADSIAGQALRQAHRLQALHAAVHEDDVATAFRRLRGRGIDAVLGKGWAAARLYPDPALRPYGDVDLYVNAAEYDVARQAAFDATAPACPVDLHAGLAELDDRTPGDVHAHGVTVELNGVAVRTFGPEDHLRLLCLHALRHGLLRPLWLCDIAAALEAVAPSFDWTRFTYGDPRRTQWAATTLRLAHELLGASLSAVPDALPPALPRWLRPAVLREWGAARRPQGARDPMSLARPLAFLRGLRVRWPNAIEATIGVGGAFSGWPRLPYQVAESVRRSAAFARRLTAAGGRA